MTILSQLYNMHSIKSNLVLIIPNEKNQILVNDYAHSISLQAFMHFNSYKFTISQKDNVEYMSQSGLIPILRNENLCIPGFYCCLNYLKAQLNDGLILDRNSVSEDVKAYLTYIDEVFTLSSLYMLWKHDDIYKNFTSKRYGYSYPFPLNTILSHLKRRKVLQQIVSNGWQHFSSKQVIEQINICCHAISEKMGTKTYIMGEKPCEVDALLYGYYYAILTSSPPTLVTLNQKISGQQKKSIDPDLNLMSRDNGSEPKISRHFEEEAYPDMDDISLAIRSTLLKYEKLLNLCYRIDTNYFSENELINGRQKLSLSNISLYSGFVDY